MPVFIPGTRLTLPRKTTKSPKQLTDVKRLEFSDKSLSASSADVQNSVPLMAVATYAFWNDRQRSER